MLEVWSEALFTRDCSLPCGEEVYPEFKNMGYVCGSLVERLPGMLDVLGSTLVRAEQNVTFILKHFVDN